MNEPAPLSDEAAAAIIEALRSHGVRFVVIGGFAIQLHQVRGVSRTADLDVTPDRKRKNLEKLAAALTALDARLRGAGLPDDGVAVEWHADLLERMDVGLNLITKFGPLDLALRPSGTDGYADLVRNPEEIPLAGTLAPTASVADIVRSKEAAGRAKDNLALPALLEHLRRPPDER